MDLALPAYVLGALLADGTIGDHSVILWSREQEIVDRVEALLPEGTCLSSHRVVQPRCVGHPIIARDGRRPGGNRVLVAMRELGLCGRRAPEKFIPPPYLTSASAVERAELLASLLDCDGAADRSGKVSYSSASRLLSSGLAELVRSLGGRCSQRVRERVFYTVAGEDSARPGRPSHIVSNIQLPGSVPFHLRRKAERVRSGTLSRHWDVVGVEPVGISPFVMLETTDPLFPVLVDDYFPVYGITPIAMGAAPQLAA